MKEIRDINFKYTAVDRKAMDSYDEDLSENPFFQSLVASYPDLFSQCILEEWLICCPRRDSLPKYAFNFEDFTHHILKPLHSHKSKQRYWSGESDCSGSSSYLQPDSSCGSSDQNSSFLSSNPDDNENGKKSSTTLKGNWNYITLSHTNVELSGRTLILDVEVPIHNSTISNNNETDEISSLNYVQLRKEVLFNETFYTNSRQRYKVLCVGSPLNSKVDFDDDGFGNSGLGLWNLTSLRDCIDFIWVKGNLKILETYDAYIKLFLHNHSGLESLPLAIQQNLVKTLFMKCMDFSINTGIAETADNPALSEFILQRLRLATETYVLNGIYRSLISAITSVMSADEAILNKIIVNLAELHPQDLEINSAHWNNLTRARYELGRINSYSSPLGKLACMKRTLRYLRPDPTAESNDANVLSTDELIPIWVYLVVKNPLGNWVAQLEFLRHFRFSASGQDENENSFYIVTLEASLEHLKTGKVLGISENERDIGMPCDLGEAWLHTLHQTALESSNLCLGEMFDAIRHGNCQKLEELIEEYELERFEQSKDQRHSKLIDNDLLCHPLCNCPKCLMLCRPVEENPPMVPAVNLSTDDGLTPLHVACIYGRPKVVDFLIGSGANLEAQDNNGMSALHYAASRGHQNALLLLLHAGSSLEPVNNNRDSPLHLAAKNGHEGCVKALVYYAEHARKNINISATNLQYDTPLHFSSRWGFQGIVNILTEHGAAITLPNVKHTTPIDCAHDIHILKILERSLNRRSLVQMNHGDFVNIEMLQKEQCGGIVMLISEPQEKPNILKNQPNEQTDNIVVSRNNSRGNSKTNSKSNSRSNSRKHSSVTLPNLLSPDSVPQSRRISSTKNPMDNSTAIIEETEKCLLSVAEHLRQDPASPDFVLNYYDDFDPTEQDHIIKISVENLDDPRASSSASTSFESFDLQEDSRSRDIKKIFTAIAVGDIPLTLFYLGIPDEELENPENCYEAIQKISYCHPLCCCTRCISKNSGLGLGLDIKNDDGYAPIHSAVQYSLLVLVKILIRYGADINLQSTYEKKTALDFAIEKGFHDMEDVLIASGGFSSNSFSPMNCECEK